MELGGNAEPKIDGPKVGKEDVGSNSVCKLEWENPYQYAQGHANLL